jgi:predicted RNA-binding protein with PUA-like domain
MAHWLLKTEPSVYSWEQLERERTTRWDGIKNPAALKHLRSSKAGDRVLIYHTGDERRAVGIAEVASAPYADPKNAKLAVVDLKAVERLAAPVELHTLKADPAFAGSPLVREGRLSFVPLTDAQYRRILQLAGK